MSRFLLLLALLSMFSLAPALIERLTDATPRWRIRLLAAAIVGLVSAWAGVLAGAFLPEVLTAARFSDLLRVCSEGFHSITSDPVARFPSLLGGVLLAALIGRLIWGLAAGVSRTRRARVTGGRPRWFLRGGRPVYVVPSGLAEAYCVGCVRPQVVVTEEMLAVLDEDEQRAVLLHEEGHATAHHQLLLLVARAVHGALRPLPYAGRALRLLEQALEESADEYAALVIGDRAIVASGLSKAALASLQRSTAVLAMDGGPDVPARVRRLLYVRETPRWVRLTCAAVFSALLGGFALTQAVAGLALLAAVHHFLGVGAVMSCPLIKRS